jgi:hypothetical protein
MKKKKPKPVFKKSLSTKLPDLKEDPPVLKK